MNVDSLDSLNGLNPASRPVTAGAEWVRDPGRRRSSRSTTGYLSSVRLGGGLLVFESRLERDCQILLDVDHDLRFSAQPETFRWLGGGRVRRWTPDLRVEDLRDGMVLFVEVKPSAVVERCPDLGGRVQGMVERCAERGAGFALLTECEIRGPALAVARRIRCAADRCDDATTAMLLDVLSPVRLPRPLAALEALFVRPADRFALLGLLGRGFLRFDPTLGLRPDTPIPLGPQAWR